MLGIIDEKNNNVNAIVDDEKDTILYKILEDITDEEPKEFLDFIHGVVKKRF